MLKNKGQSIIEYSVLAALIILGVFVMGPYVLRSVNAHFKLWQESIDDSVNDRMLQSSTKLDAGTCSCGGKVYGGCGAVKQQDNSSCRPDEVYWYTQCYPPTCGFGGNGFSEGCEPNADCCKQFVSCSGNGAPGVVNDCCGKVPLSAPGVYRSSDPTVNLPVLSASGDAATACQYGEQLVIGACNSIGHSDYACQSTGSDACKPSCIGPDPLTDGDGNIIVHACPGPDKTQDYPVVYSTDGSCPDPAGAASTCTYVCNAGYTTVLDSVTHKFVGCAPIVPPCNPTVPGSCPAVKLDCNTDASKVPGLRIDPYRNIWDNLKPSKAHPTVQTTFSCQTGEFLVGYCARGTDHPIYRWLTEMPSQYPVKNGPSRTMSTVTLIQGGSPSTDTFDVDIYCMPCSSVCASGKCAYYQNPDPKKQVRTCVYGTTPKQCGTKAGSYTGGDSSITCK